MDNVQTVYPLTPMQQGMLFHSLHEPESADYFRQVSLTLEGPVDRAALRLAWSKAVERHPALRTGFLWESVSAPVQVVFQDAELEWNHYAWNGSSDADASSWANSIAEADIRRNFDLKRAPLMRCSFVDIGDRSRFILSFHHIILDGWSVPILLGEVLEDYRAAIAGTVLEREEAPPFRDYVAWLARQDETAAKSFWQEYLRDVETGTPLDIDQPAGAQSHSYGEHNLRLSADVFASLRTFARENRLTINTVVQGIWALLLGRYNRSSDVVFGGVVSGRPAALPQSGRTVGLFINSLPVRVRIPNSGSVVEWLRSLQLQQAETVPFEFAPLTKIREWSGLAVDQPLFESLLVFENYPTADAFRANGLAVREVRSFERTNYPLTLTVEVSDVLSVLFSFDGTRFKADTIARIADQFAGALAYLVQHGDAVPDRIPLITAAEQALMAGWNATAAAYDTDRTVMDFIESQAARTPDAPALVFEGGTATYRQLNEKANRLARALQSRGVGPESLVGVCMERSLELVAALWAVMKAGGAYVPFDPEYPQERLALLTADTNPVLLLVQRRLRSRLDDVKAPVLEIDAEWPELAEQSGEDLRPTAGPKNLAYMIYTSGSTGRPKGAMNEHRALSNRLQWMQDAFPIGPGERVLQKTPFSFDVSVWEFFWPFMAGATLVVARPGGHREPDYLARLIEDEGVTTLHFVPSMLEVFLQAGAADRCGSLRRVICSGEALPFELQERFFEQLPEVELHNLYGPTEAAIDVTSWACKPGSPDRNVPIGRPIANTQMYVLDERMQRVPIGAPGELYIGGVAVGRGYWKRPELTAASFPPDPFEDDGSCGRLYKTGDLCRFRADGAIEYLGRLDNQVKLRGLRIELGEIESELRRLEGVRECVVVAREDNAGEKRLVAYLTGDGVDTADALRLRLRDRLPEYMIPSAFVRLQALPLSPNGKVDRGALPKPDAPVSSLGDAFVAPSTPAEETLARIWGAVLRVERVGVHDNFFDLGGDSILSIRVVSRATQTGLRISTRLLFDNPTIAELAPLAAAGEGLRAEQGVVSGPTPFTPIQRWFLDQNLEEPSHFNQAVLLECRDRVDPTALERAVAALVAHHDALRLRLVRQDGGLSQENAPVETARIFSILHGADLAAKDALQASLDLFRGPLLRAALIERGAQLPQQVLFVVHHWSVDGVSWRILLEDLEAAYRAAAEGGKVELPDKTTSFRQWAIQLQRFAADASTGEQLEWWRKIVAAPPARVPFDFPAGAGKVANERTVRRRIDGTEMANRLSRAQEFLAAAVISSISNGAIGAIRIDVEGHGRESFDSSVEVSRTVGWFTSIHPVRVDPSAPDLVAEVETQLREASRRSLWFGLLRHGDLDDAGLTSADYEPATILFNYLGQFEHEGQPSRFRLTSGETGLARGPRNRRAYALECHAFVLDGALEVVWTYSEGQYRLATIERVADACVTALRSFLNLAEDRRPRPADFPLVDLDRAQLDRIAQQGAISDVRPLSPLQQGMLFENIYQESRGTNVEQLSCRVSGDLDPAAFSRAWIAAARRHEALRTAFFWQGLAEPVQASFEDSLLEVRFLDWSGLPSREVDAHIAAHLREEREAGFDLSHLPLMKLSLARLADGSHQFIWSWHHVVMDGWCLPIVLRDVFELYRAEREGDLPELGPVSPYREYFVWLAERSPDEARDFWARELAGFTEPTPIPIPSPATAGANAESERYQLRRVSLSAERTAELTRFARARQLTLSTLVQAAWALLLSRYGDRYDVLFGTVVSGRPEQLPGVESMVGLFANTLPFRVKVDPKRKVGDWLSELQRRFLEMRRFEYGQLAEMQRASGVPAGRRLFESLVAFENYPVDDAVGRAARDLRIDDTQIYEQPELPLSLVAAPGERLSLGLLYDVALFDAEAIGRALEHVQNLLSSLSTDGEACLADVAMLGQTEHLALAESWNRTQREYPRTAGVGALFAEQAQSSPTLPAVVHGDRTLTYGELEERSNRLANHLLGTGVKKGDVVGICLERGLDLVTGLLAIVKTGAAYLPLDADFPLARLQFMLEDSGASVLLTDAKRAAKFPSQSVATLVLLDDHEAQIRLESADAPAQTCEGGDLIYVMYTSGSTGQPKGIEILHRGVTRLVKNTDYIGWEAADRIAQASTVSFDAATFEIWGALLNGLPLVIADRNTLLDPRGCGEWLRSQRITVLFLTTALFNQMARSGEDVFAGLRVLLFGGEAVDMRSVRQVWLEDRPTHLLHVYGPTEATTFATWRELSSSDVARDAPAAPIGLPIANTELYLLDRSARLVPLGVTGEIYLGGDGIARGYRNRPELTAERFVDHPWRPGAKLYKTGDLGKRRSDGAIEFVGRADDQVKVRGFRIELGEIEAAIREQQGVRDAAVIVRQSEDGAKRIVAYVSSTDGTADETLLREGLKARLPEYMAPAAIVSLPNLPLNANGKVDRTALPAPTDVPKKRERNAEAPSTQAETLLASIWREVLSVPEVGLDDNFFEIGGDSILSIQVVSRARSAGLAMTARKVFENQTIRELAAVCGEPDPNPENASSSSRKNGGADREGKSAYAAAQINEQDLQKLLGSIPGARK